MTENPRQLADELNEVEWTAVLYLMDELDEEQRRSFESLLEHDSTAQLALAHMTRVWTIANASGNRQPETTRETIDSYRIGELASDSFGSGVRHDPTRAWRRPAKWLAAMVCFGLIFGGFWWWPQNAGIDDRNLTDAHDLAEAWSTQIDSDPNSDFALLESVDFDGDGVGDSDWLLAALMSLDEGQTDEILQ